MQLSKRRKLSKRTRRPFQYRTLAFGYTSASPEDDAAICADETCMTEMHQAALAMQCVNVRRCVVRDRAQPLDPIAIGPFASLEACSSVF